MDSQLVGQGTTQDLKGIRGEFMVCNSGLVEGILQYCNGFNIPEEIEGRMIFPGA